MAKDTKRSKEGFRMGIIDNKTPNTTWDRIVADSLFNLEASGGKPIAYEVKETATKLGKKTVVVTITFEGVIVA